MSDGLKKTKIGKTIAMLRKESGYTQKSLADKLYISDKAVSKWERGLSYPDVTFINKLAKIFDVDTDSLFIEEDKSVASNWGGVLYFRNGVSCVKFRDKICDKYILEIIICYYLLASISNIFIICDGDNYRFAKEFVLKYGAYSINVSVIKTTEFLTKKNKYINSNITSIMLIYDLFFIYGVGLTSSLQRAMLDKTKTIALSNPQIPIVFGPKSLILSMLKCSDYSKNVETINLFRGYLVIKLNSISGIKKCSKLFKIIEEVSGNSLYDIDEIVRIRRL